MYCKSHIGNEGDFVCTSIFPSVPSVEIFVFKNDIGSHITFNIHGIKLLCIMQKYVAHS